MQRTKNAGHCLLSQLIGLLPKHLIQEAAIETKADKYYKSLKAEQHLYLLLYGVISRSDSLNSLIKNLLFFEKQLIHLGFKEPPARSTFSDSNRKRDCSFFRNVYEKLVDYYKDTLKNSYLPPSEYNKIDYQKVCVFDATTISLFNELFKGAGRKPLSGKKKGGVKVQAKLAMDSRVPSVVCVSDASKNDKSVLGQLDLAKGSINIFDKGYLNLDRFAKWTKEGIFFVTRLNANAVYEVLEEHSIEASENGGSRADKAIRMQTNQLKCRLIEYKDPVSGKTLEFLTNLPKEDTEDKEGYGANTVARLYKMRWEIEVLFKQLKQNFELGYFYSDSRNGIESQIWVVMIANLIFQVIHKQVKECECFMAIVSMARANMLSRLSFHWVICQAVSSAKVEKLGKVQLELFGDGKQNQEGGVLENEEKAPSSG